MAIKTIDELKKDKGLNSQALSLSKQLSADNLQRTIAYVSLTVLIIVAFFVSLADAKFDWTKVTEAKFWIDFAVTVGGGLFLKWVFGRYGNYEGHRNKEVVKSLLQIEKDNLDIETAGLLSLFKEYITFNNWTRKLKAIRSKVFHKLGKNPKKQKWLDQKKCVKLQEFILYPATTEEEADEAKNKLEDLNFDLDAYDIKYSMIKEDTLRTGFTSASDTDEEALTYSEMWQLFGKSSIVTFLTTFVSILLAVSSVLMQDLSMATFFIFFTRIGIFFVNSYVGFAISKTAVERVKLNVLKNIHSFLRTFLDANDVPMRGEE